MMGLAGSSEISTRIDDVTFQKTIIFINPNRRSPMISLPNSFSHVGKKKTLLNLWCKTDSVLTPRSNNSISFNHSFIHSFIHSFRSLSYRQFHSIFQSEFSTQGELVRLPSVSVSSRFLTVIQGLLTSSSSSSLHFYPCIYRSFNNVF